MEKQFFEVETDAYNTNVNIAYITEWWTNHEADLRIVINGVALEVDKNAKGYKELLKALVERTVS